MDSLLKLEPLLREALCEDLGDGDITTEAVIGGRKMLSGRDAFAQVVARDVLILAGWPVFSRVFQLLGDAVSEQENREGDLVQPGVIGTIQADASVLLGAERVALNLFQRTCGIATLTRKIVDLVAHTGAQIMDTRKTMPLWRTLDKYAVRIGGGVNHRWSLGDAILIKENHIAMAGGVEKAVSAALQHSPHLGRVEVEVETLAQLQEALSAGAEIILLDNMSPARVRRAVKVAAGICSLEVSGGITLDNVVDYAETGVDFISIGALTHSPPASDISLRFSK
jgi:nicotinate-nucleotide pyrophosphorylase (carboxylating)